MTEIIQSLAAKSMRIPDIRKTIGEKQFVDYVNTLGPDELTELLFDWESWARESQLEPLGDWSIWLFLAGRGAGKTRTGAEWIRKREKKRLAKRIALVSQSAADARDVMVEGEAGILSIYPKRDRPLYEPSKRRLTWPSGAVATIYTAEDPDQLRGPSHDTAWVDEPAAFRNVEELWSNLMFGLRLGDSKCFASTTPRPIKFIKDLIARSMNLDPKDLLRNFEPSDDRVRDVYVTTGSTYDNRENLSSTFFSQIITQYEGTRLGRQELKAEILEDIEGALWSHETLDKNRVQVAPKLKRIVVAVDPMGASAAEKKKRFNLDQQKSQTGIIVGGLGFDGEGYCLADLTMHGTPSEWAKKVIDGYRSFEADRVVAEKNYGGDMVETTIVAAAGGEYVPVTLVWASRGKLIRAEPVSTLDEKGKIHIVGTLAKLEDELCTYDGTGDSPNRLDAYVWLFSFLMVKKSMMRGAVWGRNSRRRRAS